MGRAGRRASVPIHSASDEEKFRGVYAHINFPHKDGGAVIWDRNKSVCLSGSTFIVIIIIVFN